LVRVLDQYLADLETGCPPDRQKLLAEHPELASQLEPCLAGIEFIHRASRPAAETPSRLGDFRIVREVGRGGMGVVYEAEQISLKRRVALKVLRFGGVADREALERFQREAETVAQLHHTNIVPIFAVGREQEVSYYAMQYIEGRSLADVFLEARNSGHALDSADVAGWGLQAAEALGHAHQRGVIHRDVKPSNLMLDPDGRLWLTDFGLAKRLDEVTLSLSGVLLGTPRYMSPEQASAAKLPVDRRTDIYSLGVTLYELATGRPVFDADSPAGNDHPQVHCQRAGPAIRHGSGGGGRPPSVRRGPGDQGPPSQSGRAHRALGPQTAPQRGAGSGSSGHRGVRGRRRDSRLALAPPGANGADRADHRRSLARGRRAGCQRRAGDPKFPGAHARAGYPACRFLPIATVRARGAESNLAVGSRAKFTK
jgi:tRNA A-37 threonylcarbamoyl transferase component Bud32